MTIETLQEFKAADTLRITNSCPWIGGHRAEFYGINSGEGTVRLDKGGWLVYTEVSISGYLSETVRKVSEATLEKVYAVEFDPYNDAGMALAYIAIAESVLK